MMSGMNEFAAIWAMLRAGETIEITTKFGITVWSGVNAVSAAYDPDKVTDPVAMVAALLERARDPASFDMADEPAKPTSPLFVP